MSLCVLLDVLLLAPLGRSRSIDNSSLPLPDRPSASVSLVVLLELLGVSGLRMVSGGLVLGLSWSTSPSNGAGGGPKGGVLRTWKKS